MKKCPKCEKRSLVDFYDEDGYHIKYCKNGECPWNCAGCALGECR